MNCYGLRKDIFAEIVLETLFKSKLSHREAAELLGFSTSAFTRIKYQKAIHIDSFMILLHWIVKVQYPRFTYETLIDKLMDLKEIKPLT